MHPAYSVIVFTTASGAGYGLMFWLGLRALAAPGPGAALDLAALGLGLALVTAGLLSSTFHLGHPERAWRAVTQWRSSWLSREGVAAIVTYAPAGLLGLAWLAEAPGLAALAGALLAAGCVATVWCTAMIYASLRTIPEWNDALVAPLYLLLAAGTGGLLAALLAPGAAGLAALAGALLLLAGAAKLVYWRRVDRAGLPQDAAQAIGIPGAARIRSLDPPHTQPNFVMREMGYRVGRAHAATLRTIAAALLFAAAPALALLAATLPGLAVPILLLAVAVAGVGVVTERWLFFAQARHLSMLYYETEGARPAGEASPPRPGMPRS